MPMDWLKLISTVAPMIQATSKVAGDTAGGRATGRQAEAVINNARDNTAMQGYGIQQGAQNQAGQLDLQRKNFTEDARKGRAQQALMGDMFSHYSPVDINTPGVPHSQISGGLQIGEGGKQAMGELMKQALMAQLQGDTFTGGKLLTPPAQTPLPQPGKLDSFLNSLGTFGSLAGSVAANLPQKGGGGLPQSGYDAGNGASSAQAIQDNLKRLGVTPFNGNIMQEPIR